MQTLTDTTYVFHALEADRTQTKHQQFRAHLIQEIKEGRLRGGDALPTEVKIASAVKMARNTVRQALLELEREGLIRRIPGRGTFIHEAARQRLKSGMDIFALVIPETRSAYYPSLQRGFHEASRGLHNQVIVCDTDNDPFRQADTLLQLADKKVAGIALVPTLIPPTPAHQIRPLQERGVPIVFCHRRVEGILAPLVTFSGLEVGRLAGRALIEKKHHRVAFFSGHRSELSEQYEQGLRLAMRQGGGELPPDFIFYDNAIRLTPEHKNFVLANLETLLRNPSPPTAIFCAFDLEAELVFLLLNELGVKVPKELSLLGFGGTWRQSAFSQRLTSVTVDEEQLGRQAVKLLGEMRHGERPLNDVTDIFIPLGLSAGETLGLNAREPDPVRKR
jgi:GntR family transcriptional regulator of arabinose operon